MIDLDRTVRMLQKRREELLNELSAIDKAIAALSGTPVVEAHHQDESVKSASPQTAVVPTRVKPRRVLTETHKQAMIAGRRKAREAKEVAAGTAREMPQEGLVPAIAAGNGSDTPRLVKRTQGIGR